MMFIRNAYAIGLLVICSIFVGCVEELAPFQEIVEQDGSKDMGGTVVVDAGGLCGSGSSSVLGERCEQSGGLGCGFWSCVNGQPSCESEYRAAVELCNGVDDDCDRAPDEDFPELGQPCQMDVLVNGQTATGKKVCNPEQQSMATDSTYPYKCECCIEGEQGCEPEKQCVLGCASSPEICNGMDDDCDGKLDEDTEQACEISIDGCLVAGKVECQQGFMSACIAPVPIPPDCSCLVDATTPSQYLLCPQAVNWGDAKALCNALQLGTTQGGGSNFPFGDVVEIQTPIEQNRLSTALFEQGDWTQRFWLNHRYDPAQERQTFDQWFSDNFGPGAFSAIRSFSDFNITEERCLSVRNDSPYEWDFELCARPVGQEQAAMVCEFCPNSNQDMDNDEHSPCVDDCDDENGNIYYGAPEICYNGEDDNCDGQIDEGCPCAARVFGTHKYLFCHNNDADGLFRNWGEARQYCQQYVMDLVVVNSLDEFEWLVGLAEIFNDDDFYWFGVHQPDRGTDTDSDDVDATRPWFWVDGSMSQENASWWQDGSRSRHDRAERDCGRLNPRNGELRPDECQDDLAFICETR